MYKVMIIDDEKAIRSLLRITLEKENLNLNIVGEAASGIEAINTIDNYKPDIAFVDIRMPFMDGIEFSNGAFKDCGMLIYNDNQQVFSGGSGCG